MFIWLFINKKGGVEELTVSVDADWQKRGSGRSFDSLSGNIQILSGTLNWLQTILGKISWNFVVQENYLIYMLLFFIN